MTELIVPTRSLGYPNIYIDFLLGAESARHFYLSSNPGDVANKLDAIDYDREALVRMLSRQNTQFGASQKAMDTIKRLADPRAVVVATGQQCVLFGGPQLILYKAIAVAKAAAWLEREIGRPVVPLFWIAADDHDFQEINNTWLLNRNSDLERIAYDAESAGVSASEVRFDDPAKLREMLDRAMQILGESEFTGSLYDSLTSSYCEGTSFVDAFGRFMASVTARLGIPFFSPADPESKKLSARFFVTLVERQTDLHQIITTTNRDIVQQGYHIQAEKRDDSMNLFYHTPVRQPIHRAGNICTCGDESYTTERLLDLIHEYPDRFSTDVITRPLLQSSLFPVISQIGGPSEIAYLAQVNPLFRVFGLAAPYYIARPSATIIEYRGKRQMQEYGVSFSEFTGDIEAVVNRVMAQSFSTDVDDVLKRMSARVNEAFHSELESIVSLEPSLRDFAKQSYGKIDFSIKIFHDKVFAAHKRRQKDTRERIYKMGRVLFPNKSLQERVVNSTYFLSRHGLGLVDQLTEKISLHEPAHQIINVGVE